MTQDNVQGVHRLRPEVEVGDAKNSFFRWSVSPPIPTPGGRGSNLVASFTAVALPGELLSGSCEEMLVFDDVDSRSSPTPIGREELETGFALLSVWSEESPWPLGASTGPLTTLNRSECARAFFWPVGTATKLYIGSVLGGSASFAGSLALELAWFVGAGVKAIRPIVGLIEEATRRSCEGPKGAVEDEKR